MIRTREAGTLRAEDVGQSVTLAGWIGRRRDHGGVAFLDLRDASGVVQVVEQAGASHPQLAEEALLGRRPVEAHRALQLASLDQLLDRHCRPEAGRSEQVMSTAVAGGALLQRRLDRRCLLRDSG